MFRRIVMLAATVCMLSLIAWSVGAEKHESYPSPDAEAFWEYVTEVDPYEGWGFWPGHVGMYKGESPHGAYLKFYANSVALKAIREGTRPLPDGSILMKANYAKDKETLKSLTPMYKSEGYNPEAGDWFWAKYKPNGSVQASGQVKGCIDCHKQVQSEDWIFTPPDSE
ncbi:MAG: cytochrome P460 family protein [Desulfohalobiaceae bacterium]